MAFDLRPPRNFHNYPTEYKLLSPNHDNMVHTAMILIYIGGAYWTMHDIPV